MVTDYKKIICLTPVFNDWESFSILTNEIYESFKDQYFNIEIIAINDGSIDDFEINNNYNQLIEVVNLNTNIGHQRAIAVGLHYINDVKKNFDFVIVLDADGEDKPQDIVSLIKKCIELNSSKIVFAQRKKREESLLFKTGYFFYKFLFYLMTNQKINFGNFSCIPGKLLKRVVVQDNLWNHYSGSIIQAKTPYDKVILNRGIRYAGHSKMNFTSLVLHGLSSVSVYFDFLSVRILKISSFGVGLCLLSVISILYLKLFTESSIPGWASNLILIIFTIILQLSSVTLIVLLMQLSTRKNIKSTNLYIYKDFIENINQI